MFHHSSIYFNDSLCCFNCLKFFQSFLNIFSTLLFQFLGKTWNLEKKTCLEIYLGMTVSQLRRLATIDRVLCPEVEIQKPKNLPSRNFVRTWGHTGRRELASGIMRVQQVEWVLQPFAGENIPLKTWKNCAKWKNGFWTFLGLPTPLARSTFCETMWDRYLLFTYTSSVCNMDVEWRAFVSSVCNMDEEGLSGGQSETARRSRGQPTTPKRLGSPPGCQDLGYHWTKLRPLRRTNLHGFDGDCDQQTAESARNVPHQL